MTSDTASTGSGPAVAYPPAPWHMSGQMWLSLFRLADDADDLRPAGIYGAAWVSYEPDSPLTYSELLVARPVTSQSAGRCVSITDIWVDSPASVAGGRGLWAIPKELCEFTDQRSGGLVSRTSWAASDVDGPIATARFTDVSRLAIRTPMKGATWQPAIDAHAEPVAASLTGSGRGLPCRGHWEFRADGPLGWLSQARQLASFRMVDFRMSFG